MHKNNHCGNREGRRIFRKPAAALAAAALLVSLAACSGGEQASLPSASPEGSASMGEMTLGGNRVTIPTDEVILKPSEMGMYPEKEHSFPYLGMDVVLPDSLVEKCKPAMWSSSARRKWMPMDRSPTRFSPGAH